MPRHREQKPLLPVALTRPERKAAETSAAAKAASEKARAEDVKKIARLKALRLARNADTAPDAGAAAPGRRIDSDRT